jgi:hypothetical protein
MTKPAKHRWFVSYKQLTSLRHARATETFANEIDAKRFVQSKMSEKDIYAGTINPHRPKRTVTSHQIAGWLDEG